MKQKDGPMLPSDPAFELNPLAPPSVLSPVALPGSEKDHHNAEKEDALRTTSLISPGITDIPAEHGPLIRLSKLKSSSRMTLGWMKAFCYGQLQCMLL